MLMRTDPFRDLDRLTQQVFGTAARPAFMPMDAWRSGDMFHIEFDLPGVSTESIDLDVERNVLTVRAERGQANSENNDGAEVIAAERPRGVFSRQIILGDNLNLDAVEATYNDGVLHLTVPVAEKAKPRKISVESGSSDGNSKVITAD
ncbi:MAG TPA: Hsp20/alpha crystallin family protein [Propionibacteriaceae bacterium]|jgi:HSP20 family protein|nr:Hsp20/alpha crystallin family protein [Propionibacteriaceae bacterium]